MKVSNASAQTTLRHSTAASQGDRAPTSASSLGLRVTDGGGTIVYPVRVMNFRGANVVDLGSAEIDVLIRGTGTNFTNDAGSTLAYGAVVVVDSSSNLVTTTTAQNTRPVGVVQRSTDDANPAPIVFSGYVAQINTTGTVNALDFLETSTSAGLARSSGTTRRIGSFAQALAAGPNPPAIMWSPPDPVTGSGGGGAASGVWTNYTPTWTSAGTQPSLGNGTLTGRYKVFDSSTVAIKIQMTAGSTTTYGTGEERLGFPSGMVAKTSGGNARQIGPGWFLSNGVIIRRGISVAVAGTAYGIILLAEVGQEWRGQDYAPATGDEAILEFFLEIDPI